MNNETNVEGLNVSPAIAKPMLGVVLCPDCFGDGKETCHNPDHGFLSMIGSVVGANESACPCCGHSEDHKIRKYIGWIDGKMKWEQPKCYTCDGTGQVTKEDYDKFLDENVPEDDRDYVDEKCLKNYA